MGLECIGAVGAAEQAEVVRLALESLASLEVPTVLEVSHMGFVTALLDTLHVDAAARPRLLELLRDKTPTSCMPPRCKAGWMKPPPTR